MDPYTGEIRMFGGTFAPVKWALCDGQVLSIQDNDELFALIGTRYGGNGTSTFALPDLRGRLPVGQGTGAGLSTWPLGASQGAEHVQLTASQIPSHTHTAMGTTAAAATTTAAGSVLATVDKNIYSAPAENIPLAPSTVGAVGGDQPHSNMQPFMCLNFIICLDGLFPPRS